MNMVDLKLIINRRFLAFPFVRNIEILKVMLSDEL